MSFIPEDELKKGGEINLTPMVDFLFLMLMFFACMAVSRDMTKDTDIELVTIDSEATEVAAVPSDLKVINININGLGEYKWVTDIRDYAMESPESIGDELVAQHTQGLLPEDKNSTQVLLKIDKDAKWEPILKAIFAVRDAGFDARPVYMESE